MEDLASIKQSCMAEMEAWEDLKKDVQDLALLHRLPGKIFSLPLHRCGRIAPYFSALRIAAPGADHPQDSTPLRYTNRWHLDLPSIPRY